MFSKEHLQYHQRILKEIEYMCGVPVTPLIDTRSKKEIQREERNLNWASNKVSQLLTTFRPI